MVMEGIRQKKFNHLFKVFDADNNGYLDMTDVVILMDRFNREFNWVRGGSSDTQFRGAFLKIWTKMFREADVNNDHKVSKEEFLNYYEKVTSSDRQFYAYLKPFLDDLFPAIDQNNDGLLSKESYCAFYRACNNSDDEAQKAFDTIDTNKDGVVSHLEFYSMFYQFHMSDNPRHPSRNFFGKCA
ncbi:MAG: hypothetical protein CL840_06135 [Crocinitomicaceae bacterium]|nr:hypothetical protein [Crocinitomicaceae bacterium]|tara:strand:+ start:359 stop:910 length:552 start_codon:yes stop_codon:yes gene_type:complete